MKRVVIIALALMGLLIPNLAFAGQAVWNQSGTHAAYIDLVEPGSYGRTVIFYEKQNDLRTRGTYFAFTAPMNREAVDPPCIDIPSLRVLEWQDDNSVIVQATNNTDSDCVQYLVFLDGSVRFHKFENLSEETNFWFQRCQDLDISDNLAFLEPEDVVWDFMPESIIISDFLNGLVNGTVEINENICPLSVAYVYTFEDLRAALDEYWSDPLPILCIHPQTGYDSDNVFVSVCGCYGYYLQVLDGKAFLVSFGGWG